jgi:hypothetical protein
MEKHNTMTLPSSPTATFVQADTHTFQTLTGSSAVSEKLHVNPFKTLP